MNGSDYPNEHSAKTVTTDDYLRAVTIGDRPPLNSTVYLAPYDSAWSLQFLQHASCIRAALGKNALLLEHVGSTSVPGLAAKPIIDIVLAVANSADEPAYIPPLEENGFVLKIREPDWFEHRLLKTLNLTVNLHVFSIGCEEIDRMITFRDWLRDHDDDRQLYEDTKRNLAARVWKDIQNYADAKSDVVQEIMTRAIPSMIEPDDRNKQISNPDH